MKKTLSLLLALTLAFSFTVFGNAVASISREDYLNEYDEYVSYYENTYVPAYMEYNDTLDTFAEWINQNSSALSAKQLTDIIDFLKDLKTRRSNFFGDRTTPGKSRYDVPLYRNAMMEAAENENYVLALTNKDMLMQKVEERVNFLTGLMTEIQNYIIADDPEPVMDVSAEFIVTRDYGFGYYEFVIIITNNSDKDISNWKLSFDYDGKIGAMWFDDGSANVFASSGNHYSMKTTNHWQRAYTIPAGATIKIRGNGNECGTSISYAAINDYQINMTFEKK